eukprot:GHVU01042659.1.p1 GENE.GHVU01042659.1~~GHVU01042659.1.p1  ORF type:complete len:606 (-),score=47.55 GHVU01042659.1:690-2375(-)
MASIGALQPLERGIDGPIRAGTQGGTLEEMEVDEPGSSLTDPFYGMSRMSIEAINKYNWRYRLLHGYLLRLVDAVSSGDHQRSPALAQMYQEVKLRAQNDITDIADHLVHVHAGFTAVYDRSSLFSTSAVPWTVVNGAFTALNDYVDAWMLGPTNYMNARAKASRQREFLRRVVVFLRLAIEVAVDDFVGTRKLQLTLPNAYYESKLECDTAPETTICVYAQQLDVVCDLMEAWKGPATIGLPLSLSGNRVKEYFGHHGLTPFIALRIDTWNKALQPLVSEKLSDVIRGDTEVSPARILASLLSTPSEKLLNIHQNATTDGGDDWLSLLKGFSEQTLTVLKEILAEQEAAEAMRKMHEIEPLAAALGNALVNFLDTIMTYLCFGTPTSIIPSPVTSTDTLRAATTGSQHNAVNRFWLRYAHRFTRDLLESLQMSIAEGHVENAHPWLEDVNRHVASAQCDDAPHGGLCVNPAILTYMACVTTIDSSESSVNLRPGGFAAKVTRLETRGIDFGTIRNVADVSWLEHHRDTTTFVENVEQVVSRLKSAVGGAVESPTSMEYDV